MNHFKFSRCLQNFDSSIPSCDDNSVSVLLVKCLIRTISAFLVCDQVCDSSINTCDHKSLSVLLDKCLIRTISAFLARDQACYNSSSAVRNFGSEEMVHQPVSHELNPSASPFE